MASPRRGTRTYRNDLRTKQAGATRTAIVSALTSELARTHETGEELSLARAATAAGVSVRTVYHHFPDRASQLAAVTAQLEAAQAAEPSPQALGELPAYAARATHAALSNPAQLRAEVVLNRPPQKRDHAIGRAIAKQTDAATAKVVSAAITSTLSAELALLLLDRHRLEPAQAELAITWMVQVLVDAVKNGDVPASSFKRTRRS